MKIQFIGTGSIRDISNSASVLINEHILFDIPNGNLKAMVRQKIDILKIDTVIISHTHADHCFDIPFLLWYKKNYSKNNEEKVTKVITDEITRRTGEKLIELSHYNCASKAKVEWIDSKQIDNTKTEEGLIISKETMEHRGIEFATGYRIKEKHSNISIGLTGDTSFCKGIKKLASNVDYLISDVTLEVGDDSHMGINNLLELLKQYPNLKIIPIHMYDETREKIKKMNLKNIRIPEDGDIIEIK